MNETGKASLVQSPKNKDAKKLDLFGRKTYSTASLQLCIANQQVLQFADSLSQEAKWEFTAVVEEGKTVARVSPSGMGCCRLGSAGNGIRHRHES